MTLAASEHGQHLRVPHRGPGPEPGSRTMVHRSKILPSAALREGMRVDLPFGNHGKPCPAFLGGESVFIER